MNAASGTVRWESSCREAAGLAGCFARYGPLRNAFLQGEIFYNKHTQRRCLLAILNIITAAVEFRRYAGLCGLMVRPAYDSLFVHVYHCLTLHTAM